MKEWVKILVTLILWVGLVALCKILADSHNLSTPGAGVIIIGGLTVTFFLWCGETIVSIVKIIFDWMQ